MSNFFKIRHVQVDHVLTFHIGSSYNPSTIISEARLRLVGQPFCQDLSELGVKEMISLCFFSSNESVFLVAELKSWLRMVDVENFQKLHWLNGG